MRVAIVNDLRLATEALRRVVCSDPRHEIVWTAADGAEAVRLCAQNTPDVILMDLLMPVMNGAEATRRIMQSNPCAVLVVTATVAGNFALVYEALGHGAYDAVSTPELGNRTAAEAGAELLKKLASVEKINRHVKRLSGSAEAEAGSAQQSARPAPAAVMSGQMPIVAIGASTGGPAALAAILSQWPKEFPAAVVVVQHIGVEFAAPLVQWLGDRSKLKIRLASPGDNLQAGTVLVAGTNDHLVMAADRSLRYTPEPADYPYRPSADALFHSLAAHSSTPGVAVLLTGIGRDGAEGLLRMRKAGWHTIAQDEASSVVYGMPKAARDLGAAAAILSLGAMPLHISDQIRQLSTSKP